MSIQRISYGGTDLTPEQRQTFIKAVQATFPTAIVFSYPEAAVDPEGAAAFESDLQLWDVFVDVPPDLVDWLCEEVAAVVAEGFELDFLGVERLSDAEAREFKHTMAAYRVKYLIETDPETLTL